MKCFAHKSFVRGVGWGGVGWGGEGGYWVPIFFNGIFFAKVAFVEMAFVGPLNKAKIIRFKKPFFFFFHTIA